MSYFVVDLDKLTATLDIEESGKPTRYIIDLESDRSACFVTRIVLDDGEAIEEKTWLTTLQEVGNDASMPPAVMWAARGMWGIPLEFKVKPEPSAVLP
jgi:hypothetical protein